MKILFTQETDWLKRYPGQQHHLAEMLSLRGHEIRVIDFEILWRTEGGKELYSKREVFNSVTKIHNGARVTVARPGIVKVPLLDYVSLCFSQEKEIHRQIKEFAPDVIVGLGILAYLSGRAANRNNLPFVYYWTDVCHRLIPLRFLQPIGWLMERRALKMADRVLTINDKLKDYVIKLGADPEQTRVLRAGIGIERFDPSLSSDTVRRQYGLQSDDSVLFFMGWLYHFSGLKEVALELAKIKDEKTYIKLLIVGDGDGFDDLQRIREEQHLDNQVILAGKQPYEKIPAFIASSDICLLPAYPTEKIMQDIVPIKLYEYMACGKPVIATKLPGVMKEFGEDYGVIYVDKPEDVLNKTIELIENGTVKEEGLKARRFVEKYNWEDIVEEFERVLEELTGLYQMKSSKKHIISGVDEQ